MESVSVSVILSLTTGAHPKMLPGEVEQIVASLLPRLETETEPPSAADWQPLEAKFSCIFPDEFKTYIALMMSRYAFPGEILELDDRNDNDWIALAYDLEMEIETWPANMIPFYAIGNGDYFCLNRDECPASPVYYFDHEQPAYELNCSSFEIWLRELPAFLNPLGDESRRMSNEASDDGENWSI